MWFFWSLSLSGHVALLSSTVLLHSPFFVHSPWTEGRDRAGVPRPLERAGGGTEQARERGQERSVGWKSGSFSTSFTKARFPC